MIKRLALALAFCLFLATPAWSADMKIGIVDLENVIAKCEPGQKAKASLQKQFQDMKSDLEKMKTDLQKLREEYEKQSVALSQEAKMGKQKEFAAKLQESQTAYTNYQQKLKEEENKLLKPIFDLMVTVMTEYGKKNSYTLILDTKNGGVVYSSDSIDLNDEILEEFNKAWKKKGN